MPGIYLFSKTKGNRKDALKLLRGNVLHKTKNTHHNNSNGDHRRVLTEVFSERCAYTEFLVSWTLKQYVAWFVTSALMRTMTLGEVGLQLVRGEGELARCTLVKNPPANAGDEFDPWVGKIPWRRKWQPTPVLLPGKSPGQKSLAGYRPWGGTELDTS